MKEDKFIREDLEFYLPDSFKGLSKEYMLKCIFDKKIQKNWSPNVGDVIVGSTGNVWVISNYHKTHESLGGDKYFFGGGLCNRDGGNILNDTYSSVMNKDGLNYKYTKDGIVAVEDCSYSKFSDFRFVPYPHELK